MIETVAAPQPTMMQAFEDAATAPALFLSSEAIGWDGLVVRAYHEPTEMEIWIGPALLDTTLVLVTRGAMRMEQRRMNGPWQTMYARQGDLFLRPGGLGPYEVRWKGLTPGPLQTLHLHLRRELMTRIAQEVIGNDPTRLVLAERVGFQDPVLAQIGFALRDELARQNPAGRLYAETAAQMLAVHLLSRYSSVGGAVRVPTQGLTRHQMGRVSDFIQAHLSQDLSLEILARQIGLSPYHFARLFRQTTGESPHQYVLRRRVEWAERLLEETDMPLADVALECGFANQSHLTQVFKRYRGLTPRACRQGCAIGARS